MSYGLRVFNQNGGIQFDSTKKLFSYIVVAYGTASNFLTAVDDLVFIRNPVGLSSNDVVFGDRNNSTGNYTVKKRSSGGTVSNVTCDFFVIGRSFRYPTDGTSHGLVIKNADGSTQFDSRTMQTNFHYAITGSVPRLTLPGNLNDPGSIPITTDTSKYVEISRATQYSEYGAGNYDLDGLNYDSNGHPYYVGRSFEVDPDVGTITFYFDNPAPFFLGDLV